jgi:hypothetical protein
MKIAQRKEMKKLLMVSSFVVLLMSTLGAQTVLIDPMGDGGFESGTTFADNAWSVAQGNKNNYQIGNVAGQYQGDRSAFISNSSASWSSANQAATIHLYRTISFPANETDISLSFMYKMNTTDINLDGFKVYLSPTIPSNNSLPSGTQIGNTWYGSSTSWQEVSISLDGSYAGTSSYLVFTWKNNNRAPRALGALDNISLVTQSPPPPITEFPFTENFEADSEHRSKWTQIAETGSNLWIFATGAGEGTVTAAHSGSFNARFTSTSGGPFISKLVSPTFDFTGIAEANLEFWYAQELWSPDQNELKVYYRSSPLTDWVQLAHYPDNVSEWTHVWINLPNLSNSYQIAFEGIDNWGRANVIDDVQIRETAEEPVLGLTPAQLDFSMLEIGTNTEQSFSIANVGVGSLVLNRQPSLTGLDSAQYELIDPHSYPLSITFGSPASYTVRYSPDAAGTHSAQVSISYDVEHVVNLAGRAGYRIFGDGFENNTDFALELSPWTQYDGDESSTYTITDVSFLNQGYTGSYIAFNPSATVPALSGAWDAFSGARYAAAFAATTAPNNDWLISPQLSFGDDPAISFWAKSITAEYGLERFKVLYSTTGNSYSDFTHYLAGSPTEYLEAPTDWTQYIYDLPAGLANSNVYIAIQCVSNDAFVFMLDDFRAWSTSSPTPAIGVNPNPHSFADFFPNYSRYQVFTITNTGTGLLQIPESGLTLFGDAEFSLVSLPEFPIELNAGQSSEVSLRFHPTLPGNYSCTLTLTDVLSNELTVPITATTLDDLITEYPYVEGFEENVFGWVIRDADLDGYNWELLNNTETVEGQFAYTGNACLISRSRIADTTGKDTVPAPQGSASMLAENEPGAGHTPRLCCTKSEPKGALTPDNWLITPRFQIGEDYRLSWRVAAFHPDWPAETYSVLISNTTPDETEFTALFTETLSTGDWQYRDLDLSAYEGDIVYIAFRHWDTTDQYMIKLDAIKIFPYNTDVFYGIVESGEVNIDMDPIQDLSQSIPLNVNYHGSDLADAALITAHVCYDHPGLGLSNAGLHLGLSGTPFANSTMEITHGLGFAPIHAYWRIQPNAWSVISAASPEVSVWNTTTVIFTIPETGKADGDFDIVFPKNSDGTLPVELSHFGAVVSAHQVKITWVTQTETNVSGFQLYRSGTADMSAARAIGSFIPATNTSQMQSYLYVDKEVFGIGTYYYWLEHIDLDGSLETHGPVHVFFDADNGENPSVPVLSGIASIYPNPFNPSASIKVGISNPAEARLSIYNLRGQLIRTLLDQPLDQGYHTLLWDGRDDDGHACSSGVYFAVLRAGKKSFSHKLILAK